MREKEQKDAQVKNRERPGSRLVGVLQLTAALYKRRERSSSSFRIVWKGVDDATQLQQLHRRLQGNPITAQLHCCAAYRGVRVLGNLPAIGIICAVALAGYGNALQPSANQFLQVISFLPHVPSSLPPV